MPTFITELEEGLHQEIEGKVATYVVTSNESGKATVIVDGVKHDINSLEDIHKFEVDKKKLFYLIPKQTSVDIALSKRYCPLSVSLPRRLTNQSSSLPCANRSFL